jgi:hypothetical protein
LPRSFRRKGATRSRPDSIVTSEQTINECFKAVSEIGQSGKRCRREPDDLTDDF